MSGRKAEPIFEKRKPGPPKKVSKVPCYEENQFLKEVFGSAAVMGEASSTVESLPASGLPPARRKSVAARLHVSKSDTKTKSGWMWRWSKAAASKIGP